jgi:phosphoenolpyruvate-protein kinase (PTS system EI component)
VTTAAAAIMPCTSSGLVVGRSLGKPVVVGCGRGALAPLAGRALTVDGGRGLLIEGHPPLEPPAPDPAVETLLAWRQARSAQQDARSAQQDARSAQQEARDA